jgi:hypothetical protein
MSLILHLNRKKQEPTESPKDREKAEKVIDQINMLPKETRDELIHDFNITCQREWYEDHHLNFGDSNEITLLKAVEVFYKERYKDYASTQIV